jgi:predicted nucleic acid-binding protein
MAEVVIHLDTSFLIRALIGGTAEGNNLREWINSGAMLRISAIAWAEFRCSPLDSGDLSFATRIIGEPLLFATDDAVRAAELFNQSGRRRGSLVDCIIAAAAIGATASLATSNRIDFQRFRRLRLA